MALNFHYKKPLPTPPSRLVENVSGPSKPVTTSNYAPGLLSPANSTSNTIFASSSPYQNNNNQHPENPFVPFASASSYQSMSALPGGTLLHKGFYDLLALIPSQASSSKLLSNNAPKDNVIGGPRYEEINSYATDPPTGIQSSPKKGRKISKSMVSKPTGFIHLVHASDADQAEALLTRWGPDGMGKLGDPNWAIPIKLYMRDLAQKKAVNEVVNAMKPSILSGQEKLPLRVVNGISGLSSSTATHAATTPRLYQPPVDGLPQVSRTTESMPVHAIARKSFTDLGDASGNHAISQVNRLIVPSLQTLEKAVSAKIFFENLYFPLLRQPPSREQRRLAMEREMAELGLSEDQKERLRVRWTQNETDYLRERRQRVDATSFIKLKTIGHGAFGVVSLVREKRTGQLYAMKQLRKTDMLRKGQEGHVRAERDVLKSAASVSSPGGADWIVRLFYSFQDSDHLYLVLEYMGGGDLLNLLIERDTFDEDFTRFYAAEMLLAIESCHKHGFIHRDIKPDNFLFDPDGHIKLSDFGLATDLHWAHDTSYYEQQRKDLLHKHGIDLEDGGGLSEEANRRRMVRKEVDQLMGGEDGQGVFTWREKNRKKLAYSICGTNSYMSPEVIRGLGYTFSCDWWSLGVIMFECLYGFPPFVSNSRHVTRQKILNWHQSLRFPSRPAVSHDGINLIQQLLCEPEDRLGSQNSSSTTRPNSMMVQARRSMFIASSGVNGSVDGAYLIKAHPWFKGIDWENIHRYTAPFRPELRNPEDTRHFDSDIPAEPLVAANGAPADATRDPLLRHKVHGAEILNVRKALAFAGFTHKSPRVINYVKADKAFGLETSVEDGDQDIEPRNRRSRAMSM